VRRDLRVRTWSRNERVAIAAYLRVTGRCAVAMFLFALAMDFA
jgi:hypothetical protein